MLVNGVGDGLAGQCPVVGQFEETGWNMQCPVSSQWSRQAGNVCSYGIDRQTFYDNVIPQQMCYYPPIYQPVQYVPPQPLVQNLPCHQNEAWDYNSMCFNVDGQPCQYTSVVDLEDFMNNEKRKEKSRVAARCRRTKEMQIFSELTAALPAKKEEVEQLDKASVMRLAISYLKVRDVVSLLPGISPVPDSKQAMQLKVEDPEGLEEVSSELSYMRALDGFVLVLSHQGDIVYCSENIAEHLGVSQMEIMGQSVFEFSHPCDHEDIREALRIGNDKKTGRRDLLIRLKCTLTSKGRNVHLKSASYKVIHITGHMLTPDKEGNNKADEKKEKNGTLVAVGRPIPHPSNIEIPLDSKTFLSKHSLDMKFTYVDESLTNTLGFEPDELIGQSLYEYQHAGDSAAMAQQFKSLFSKGQCETGQYRFLAKTGGYAWVQTQATLITDKQQKPISIVCVYYIISGIECKDEVFAAHQVLHADVKPTLALVAPKSEPKLLPLAPAEPPANGAIVAIVPPEEERPIPVTELIFAPRKKEMNKGFLTFSHEEGLTMLKDEPEDLTHLAPTAGDACIPLESSPFDMFDEFILNDNYCSLLGDDLGSGSPVDSLTPDSLLLSSPEPNENDSSCEQPSLLTELSLDAFDSTRSDNDIDDGNSPFIPTTDELPVLEPAVMWGALPDSVSMARPQPPEPQASPAPALQRLLTATTTGPPPQDLITNIYSDPGLIPSTTVSTWDTGVKRGLKQEPAQPCAKRARRSPSPVVQKPASTPYSSVLKNLLDLQSQQPQPAPMHHVAHRQMVGYPPQRNQPQQSGLNKNAIPIVHIIQAEPVLPTNTPLQQVMRTNMPNMANPMSPLSLNIGSPMYSLPSSPNSYSSPAISPAQRERVMSPYSPYTPQSMSPIGKFHQVYSPGTRLLSPAGVIQGNDPYLTTKMQPSPNYIQNELIDTNVQLTSSDFWPDTEMLQGTNDLLTAFDDVKL